MSLLAAKGGNADISVSRIYGCQGSFIEADIEIFKTKRKIRGWISTYCSPQRSECGRNMDYPLVEESEIIEP